MMSRTHFTIGVAAGGAASIFLRIGLVESFAFALVAGLGATLPDIDTEQSKASRMLYKAVPTAALAYIVMGLSSYLIGWTPGHPSLLRVGLLAAAVMIFPTFTRLVFGHRGATHSLIVWTGLLAALYLFGAREATYLLGAAACLGSCAGGILPDAITPAGVPLFWPITDMRFHLLPSFLRIRTGGMVERLLLRPLAYAAVFLLAFRIAGLL